MSALSPVPFYMSLIYLNKNLSIQGNTQRLHLSGEADDWKLNNGVRCDSVILLVPFELLQWRSLIPTIQAFFLDPDVPDVTFLGVHRLPQPTLAIAV